MENQFKNEEKKKYKTEKTSGLLKTKTKNNP
jgi:hypothetical protein